MWHNFSPRLLVTSKCQLRFSNKEVFWRAISLVPYIALSSNHKVPTFNPTCAQQMLGAFDIWQWFIWSGFFVSGQCQVKFGSEQPLTQHFHCFHLVGFLLCSFDRITQQKTVVSMCVMKDKSYESLKNPFISQAVWMSGLIDMANICTDKWWVDVITFIYLGWHLLLNN